MNEKMVFEANAPRIAVIATIYWYSSHADVILGRLMGLFDYKPQVEVVSIYMEQILENDMVRAEAARCGIPLYSTIAEAIAAPNYEGKIDGVIIIGEHGEYPFNERMQQMYPRKRFLEETLNALDDLGLHVPIFSDKHLSYTFPETLWMYEQLKQRKIPFLGGSTIPHTNLVPDFERGLLQGLKQIVVISYSGAVEAYGFHALDVMQTFAEKRQGGESGVRSVYAVKGSVVWEMADRSEWPESLMEAALRVYPDDDRIANLRKREPEPVLFVVEYVDGTMGYVIQFNGLVEQWAFAFSDAAGNVTAARCDSELGRPYTHFAHFTTMIEKLMFSRQSPFPLERTFLSTALTNFCMDSLYEGQKRLTPELEQVVYTVKQ